MATDVSARRLGILAGAGALPLKIVSACQAARRPYAVFAIQGEADEEILNIAETVLPIGAFGKAVEQLKAHHCSDVILVGRVGRPDFSSLKLDWGGIKLLPKLIAAARHGDDALLKTVGMALESEGLRLIGVDDIAADLLAPEGIIGKIRPQPGVNEDISKAIAVITALGPYDVGQGAVVCDGLVLAIEAAEGTDAMLKRCAQLPKALRGSPSARRGVLVKMPKPRQERRIDLPTIGIRTVEGAAAAGLAGIAVASGSALILDRGAVAARADEYGLFVYGFSKDRA